ncbi:hypothetical protein TNCV_2078031 [Trichonephila clavipes]|nr:hypothetical protein TNCV_2078031 [Trichonephila clavipes]
MNERPIKSFVSSLARHQKKLMQFWYVFMKIKHCACVRVVRPFSKSRESVSDNSRREDRRPLSVTKTLRNCGDVSKDKNWSILNKDPHWVPGDPRKAAVAYFRLLTCHDCLRSHLYRIGIADSPDCATLVSL